MDDVIIFDVVDNAERKFAWYGKEPGVLYPRLPWETKYLGDMDILQNHLNTPIDSSKS